MTVAGALVSTACLALWPSSKQVLCLRDYRTGGLWEDRNGSQRVYINDAFVGLLRTNGTAGCHERSKISLMMGESMA
ncbi:hypothetical protein EV421DRAFT_1103039 [Armillaria borealis]|uniref:Secreted protein n=1 Tax=Armillaria borealis TaxID=47425 RepID=A0AA39J7B2_9AGAR|nr:hypothetical protein EV421DRAFT_1103039 [Armillaria borealis]